MRISDWSSDVCSSDLRAEADIATAVVPVQGVGAQCGANAAILLGDQDALIERIHRDRLDLAQRAGSGGVAERLLQPHTDVRPIDLEVIRSEEHTYELQSLMRISYAVFCLKKKNTKE